jgi:hypothetical protein
MFMRSERVKELITEYPFAFIILSLIAQRARWKPGVDPTTGLQQGEAMIGASDFEGHRKNCGLSRSNYRSGLNKLLSIDFITVKVTSKGTIAKICDSSIYDLNLNDTHRPSHLEVTSKSPLTKKDKKEKKDISSSKDSDIKKRESALALEKSKKPFMDKVYLTQEEHERLVSEYGAEMVTGFYQELNNYKHSTGRVYRSDYHTILNWVVGSVLQKNSRKTIFEKVRKNPLKNEDRLVPHDVGRADPIEISEGCL